MVFGKTGVKVSVVGLGFWQAGSRLWGFRGEGVSDVVKNIVKEAYEHGINFYDTAEIYGGGFSEKLLGEAVRSLGIRDQVFIASKVAGYRYNEHDILKAIENINRRLGFKHDLVQHHWPPPIYGSLCRAIHAFEKAVEKGLVSYYGLSNYNKHYLEKALECSRKYEPVSNQLQYNLGYRVVENSVKKLMDEHNMVLIAWSPLAKGALAGLDKPKTLAQKTDRVFREIVSDQDLIGALKKLSAKYGKPCSTIALSWLIYKKALPIPGTRDPRRVVEYAEAGDLVLNQEDYMLLDNVSSKYVTRWGLEYNALKNMKYVPGFLQSIAFKLMGGI